MMVSVKQSGWLDNRLRFCGQESDDYLFLANWRWFPHHPSKIPQTLYRKVRSATVPLMKTPDGAFFLALFCQINSLWNQSSNVPSRFVCCPLSCAFPLTVSVVVLSVFFILIYRSGFSSLSSPYLCFLFHGFPSWFCLSKPHQVRDLARFWIDQKTRSGNSAAGSLEAGISAF